MLVCMSKIEPNLNELRMQPGDPTAPPCIAGYALVFDLNISRRETCDEGEILLA